MGKPAKSLIFKTIGYCQYCTSHKYGIDGYLHINGSSGNIRLHSFIGRINSPDAEVIHHVCGNRWCLEPTHLIGMTLSDHIAFHNSDNDYELAYKYWINNKDITGTALAELFGLSRSGGKQWIREFKTKTGEY